MIIKNVYGTSITSCGKQQRETAGETIGDGMRPSEPKPPGSAPPAARTEQGIPSSIRGLGAWGQVIALGCGVDSARTHVDCRLLQELDVFVR